MNVYQLLGVRAALVMLLAFVVGLLAGGLTFLQSRSVAAAVLAGGGAAGAALLAFDQIIGRS
jgi:hypothetical protein